MSAGRMPSDGGLNPALNPAVDKPIMEKGSAWGFVEESERSPLANKASCCRSDHRTLENTLTLNFHKAHCH